MIHYTLLPEKELRSLKREYKTRLFIALSFFVSCSVVVGIVILVPSFLLSYTKEKDALRHIQSLQKEGQEKGIDLITSDLATTSKVVKRLQDNSSKTIFSKTIYEVLASRPSQISINSFKFNRQVLASSTSEIVIQGKSMTRDSLIKFKKNLEDNPKISKIELPVSDLAKSKDISFAIKFNMTQ